MTQADIGLIGLGVMGRNLALNIADHGYTVAVFNRSPEPTEALMNEAGPLAGRLLPQGSIADLAGAIRPPRPVLLMVKAGAPVDEQIAALRPLLNGDDIVIDAGNANYHDTRRRTAEAAGRHAFLGIGVSGGEEGARFGPSIMAGGDAAAYGRVAPILEAISAKAGGADCCARVGPDGAGHFVKTMHNGIEYADMQMIAEVYYLMRHALGMDAKAAGEVFAAWNEGPLSSYLIEITAAVLRVDDPDTGVPLVDMILDRAGEKGTGRWSVIEALDLGAPAPTIAEAVAARALSARKTERVAAEAVYGAPATEGIAERDRALADLEQALLAGKVAAYAQGFAVLAAASAKWDWHLPMAEIARIWRAGCIIRSQFLDQIATAFAADSGLANLMVAPGFVGLMRQAGDGLRRTVATAALSASPAPALSSALAYFDGYRRGRLWADLIQAQRDYFGAHTYERIDRDGSHHFDWTGAA